MNDPFAAKNQVFRKAEKPENCKATYHNYGVRKYGFCANCNGTEMKLSIDKIDNVVFDGSKHSVDIFVVSADYNGEAMNDEMLDILSEDSELLHKLVIKYLY